MSTFAKGLTIGALVSASLAAPIVAMVSYLQTRPKNTPLVLIQNPSPKYEPLATMIDEPDFIAVERLPVQPEPPRAPARWQIEVRVNEPGANGSALSATPGRDPERFELELPTVERPATLGAHYTRSPSVASNGMPPPIGEISSSQRFVYEEQFR